MPRAPKGETSQNAPAGTGIQSGQKAAIRVNVSMADNHFETVAVNKAEGYVEKQTGGDFTVEVFAGAQIGDNQEVFEGLRLEVVDMLPCGMGIIGNFSKDFGLSSLPYLFDSERQVEAVMEDEFGQPLPKELEDIGYASSEFGNFSFCRTTNGEYSVNNVEDTKGLKIRTTTTSIHLGVFETLGTNPTPMALSRLSSTLQQGVIDGQGSPLINIYTNKLHEVQKYLALDGHVSTFVASAVPKDWYDRLDPSYQRILNGGIKMITGYMKESCGSEDASTLEEIKEAGVEVVELTLEVEDEFRETVRDVDKEYDDEINPDRYKEMLDIIIAVQ